MREAYPHYHISPMARTGRTYNRTKPFFLTEAEAEQWQEGRDPEGMRKYIVLECRLPFCGPVRDHYRCRTRMILGSTSPPRLGRMVGTSPSGYDPASTRTPKRIGRPIDFLVEPSEVWIGWRNNTVVEAIIANFTHLKECSGDSLRKIQCHNQGVSDDATIDNSPRVHVSQPKCRPTRGMLA